MFRNQSFIDDYLGYVRESEPPYVYHRWSILSSIGAILGRNYYLQFGHQRIYPNLYCFLVGDAGTRKSSAIKLAAKVVRGSGYENFAANKTRLEKFLMDLSGQSFGDEDGDDGNLGYDVATDANLWGSGSNDPREVFIAADEWTDFAPRGDIDFYTLLGTLWDWDDDTVPYKHRLKNSKSVSVQQPTVSILGGTTPEKFANAFPAEIIGGGFLSRIIVVHGERSGRQFTIPPVPESNKTEEILRSLRELRIRKPTPATYNRSAYDILDAIYKNWVEIDDVRFKAYSNRRFTQLIKLCLIVSAARGVVELDADVVVEANTYLSAVEAKMPTALGEFGKSKNSDVAHKLLELLNTSSKPLTTKELWRHVHQDLEKIAALGEIMQGLLMAGKVQSIKEGKGWLPLKKRMEVGDFVNKSYLTEEEQHW